jgi:DNA-binding winged helix-turn-helix (wHTH) protein
MHTGRVVYRFGPFELDAAQRRLFKGEERVHLAERPMGVLLCLVAHAGRIVDKDTLIKAAWPETSVSDDSLRQAVATLRGTLGRQPDSAEYIATHVRKGCEFIATVEQSVSMLSIEALDELLHPVRGFINGRSALETLECDKVSDALEVFSGLLAANASSAEAHIGLATACFLTFESTRTQAVPDRARLAQAHHHALEACRLKPSSGDAWGTLALVLHRSGTTRDVLAAARKAIDLEPTDFLHHLRFAAVSWGQDRIRAAHRALSINPDLALAHWLAATVFVARGLLDRALEELWRGLAVQRAQADGRFVATGIHWLVALVLAARGELDEARAQLELELASTSERQVYGRESGANTWYAIGALSLRQRHTDTAVAAFREALARVPGHPLAMAALSGRGEASDHWQAAPLDGAASVEGAIVAATALALRDRHDAAAAVCGQALTHADPGSSGWLLPVEPVLHVAAHAHEWAPTLAVLRARAV